MRQKLRQWKNGKYPNWTARITWFAESQDDENIRLCLEDSERKINLYPKSKDRAEKIWFLFKQGAPTEGNNTAFVVDLLELVERLK